MSLKISKKVKSPVLNRLLSACEAVDAAKAKSGMARERKQQKADDRGMMTKIALLGAWVKAMKAHYPSHGCVIKDKELIILKRHVMTLYKAGVSPLDYLGWVVEAWPKVMAAKFAWMQDAPTYPQVSLMVRFSEKFQDAFADRDRIEKMANMTAKDKLVEVRKRKGMSEEAAIRDLEERAEQKVATVSKPDEARQKKIREREELARGATRVRRRIRTSTNNNQKTAEGSFGAWKE